MTKRNKKMVSDSEIQFNQSDSDNNYSDTDSEKEMNVDEKKPQISFFGRGFRKRHSRKRQI